MRLMRKSQDDSKRSKSLGRLTKYEILRRMFGITGASVVVVTMVL